MGYIRTQEDGGKVMGTTFRFTDRQIDHFIAHPDMLALQIKHLRSAVNQRIIAEGGTPGDNYVLLLGMERDYFPTEVEPEEGHRLLMQGEDMT